MEENEVTIRINVSLNEITEILNNNGFKKEGEYTINDIYMIPEEFKDIEKYDERRLLNLSVRIREFIHENITHKEIVKKDKNFDEDNRIINEEKYRCRIKDVDEANNLLEKLGYVELFKLVQYVYSYKKDNVEIVLSEINNRIYIEIESKDENGEIVFNSTDEIIEYIHKYDFPHVKGEYFVQKAIDEIKYLREKE